MFKFLLLAMACRLFAIPAKTVLRFIPKQQKRLDNRGRTVAEFESVTEGIAAYRELPGKITKEKEDGTYYLCVEVRSAEVPYLYGGHAEGDPHTLPIPFGQVSQDLPHAAQGGAAAAHPVQAAHDAQVGAAGGGTAHRPQAGQAAAAESAGPVGQVKVDLSRIGVR